MKRQNRVAILAFLSLMLAPPWAVWGQQFPTKPIHLIVPFAAGAAGDTFSRVLAQGLESRLGQPVLVENRTGASGTIAAKAVMSARPDGHTLLAGTTNLLAFPPSLVPGADYDAVKDFAPISRLYVAPLLLAVHSSTPARTLAEFVAYSKERPGKLNFGSYGTSTTSHFCMESLNHRAGLNITHVPYRGLPVLDLIGQRLDIICDNIPALNKHVVAGTVRVLAVSTAKRSPLLREVPTVAELGFRGYDISTWSAVLAPKGTPSAVVARLNEAIVGVLQTAELRKRAEPLGYESIGSSPDELVAFIRTESERWARIVAESNVKPQ